MKLNKFDVHDRFTHVTKQDFDISECCQDLIDKRPFGDHPFYIFAHARTDDDGVTKRMIWQPRLTKPKMDPNSMLFKAYPGTDIIKIFWILPAQEIWKEFESGQMFQNKTVMESIYNFRNHKKEMEAKEQDDLSDEEIDAIYREISTDAAKRRITAQHIAEFNKKFAILPKLKSEGYDKRRK